MNWNKKVCASLITLVCFSFFPLLAQVKQVPHSSKVISALKYEVFDIGFKAKKNRDKPFGIVFGAKFTAPDGECIDVPGFYNGDKQWLLRFSACYVLMAFLVILLGGTIRGLMG